MLVHVATGRQHSHTGAGFGRGEFNRQDWLGTRTCETASAFGCAGPRARPSCADEAPYTRDGMPQGKGEGGDRGTTLIGLGEPRTIRR